MNTSSVSRLALLLALPCAGLAVAGGIAFSQEGKPVVSGLKAAPTAPVAEIKDYGRWARVNPKPYYISSVLDGLCRGPATPQEYEEEAKNPHVRKFITVYVNAIGRRAMLREAKPAFPVGAVIVKEKRRSEWDEGQQTMTAKDTPKPELMTVMVKRAKGFNPANGDWEYLVVAGATGKVAERGKLERCQSCHASQKATDYVFRGYLPDEKRHALH